MRLNREIFALLALLLVFVVAGLLLSGRSGGKTHLIGREEFPDPSVYNDRASGSKGCYAWVHAIGYRPGVWRRGWDALPQSHASLLFVIDPRVGQAFSPLTGADDETSPDADKTILSPADAHSLQTWLSAGNTAVLMASRIPTGRVAGKTRGAATFGDALDLRAETSASPGASEFGPLQPLPQMRGIVSLHSASDSRLVRATPDGLCLFGDTGGPLVLTVPVGKGRLVAVADSRFASNANLPRAENAVFLARVIASAVPRGGTVLFDEFHHGDAALAADATVWSAIGHPLQLALSQILLALLLLAGVVAVRFGLPLPLGRGEGRLSTEYVASLAGLYRRARASSAALETLYRQFLRDLSGRLALAPDVNLEQLAEVAARHGGTNKEALRQLLACCEQRLDKGAVTEPELLDLTRQMEAVRKDLGLA